MSCIPSSDHTFRQAASRALAGIDGKVTTDRIAETLADVLRPTFPAVEIHRQELLARIFDDDVWYAYRDGKPRGQADPG